MKNAQKRMMKIDKKFQEILLCHLKHRESGLLFILR